jgi:hypothetical protein
MLDLAKTTNEFTLVIETAPRQLWDVGSRTDAVQAARRRATRHISSQASL